MSFKGLSGYRAEVYDVDTSLRFTAGGNTNKRIFHVTKSTSESEKFLCTSISGDESFEVTSSYLKMGMVKFHLPTVKKMKLEYLFAPGILESSALEFHLVKAIRDDKVSKKTPKSNTPKQETKKMSKTSQVINTVKDANVEAAKVTAKIAAGKALNTAVQSKIVPKMPIMVRGYAQTDLGKIVLANVVATALTYYAPNDSRAKMVSEAMIQSAMCDLMATIDVEGMVKEFLSSDAADRIVNMAE